MLTTTDFLTIVFAASVLLAMGLYSDGSYEEGLGGYLFALLVLVIALVSQYQEQQKNAMMRAFMESQAG